MTPVDHHVLTQAVQWIANVATGSIATGGATIAVATVGFALLVGRINIRRGATVILGCFILFAAPALANVFVQWANGDDAAIRQTALASSFPPTPEPPPYEPKDPYAGASLIR